MAYIHKHELLEPDHSTAPDARQRLAPIIGGIILAWNELERWLHRNIRDDRLGEETFGEAPRRQLSHKVDENINEWIKRFMPGPSNGLSPDEMRQLLLNLKTVRDDVAHNIWNYAVDPELGPFINRVRENTGYYQQEAKHLEKLHSGDTRNLQPFPAQFELYCYVEEGLIRALGDMIISEQTLLRVYGGAMQERHPPRGPQG